MRLFAAVVTDGSFTAASKRLGTDKARVSRIVQRMEDKLGARLLTRSTRRLSVTEVGRDYYERAVVILAAAEAAEAAVAHQSGEPRGLLRLTAGNEFGTMVVDRWTSVFLRQAPKVTVETEYTNRIVDIIHEGVDVAIRVGALQDSGLSARKLGDITYGLYAAPRYLKRARVSSVSDLSQHDLIMKSPRGRSTWTMMHGERAESVSASPRAAVSSTIAAMNLALEGIGIAMLPRFMAEQHVAKGALATVLAEWAPASVPVHAVFASSRFMDPKVRGFVDVCVREASTHIAPRDGPTGRAAARRSKVPDVARSARRR